MEKGHDLKLLFPRENTVLNNLKRISRSYFQSIIHTNPFLPFFLFGNRLFPEFLKEAAVFQFQVTSHTGHNISTGIVGILKWFFKEKQYNSPVLKSNLHQSVSMPAERAAASTPDNETGLSLLLEDQ